MKPCEYCHEIHLYNNKDIPSSANSRAYVTVEEFETGDEYSLSTFKTIDFQEYGVHVDVKIYYCPICGRKLGGRG